MFREFREEYVDQSVDDVELNFHIRQIVSVESSDVSFDDLDKHSEDNFFFLEENEQETHDEVHSLTVGNLWIVASI